MRHPEIIHVDVKRPICRSALPVLGGYRRLVRGLPAVLPGPLAPSFGRVARDPLGNGAILHSENAVFDPAENL